MSPRQVLRTHSSKELTEWMAFDKIEPIGARRGDVNAATVAKIMADLWSEEEHKVTDFIPEYTTPQKQDWKAQKRMVEMLNEAFGGVTVEG